MITHRREKEVYEMVTFKESSLYVLLNEALVYYIQCYDKRFSIDENIPLTIIKEKEIPYLSEWFNRKGFKWLSELEQYSFEEDKKYHDFVEFQWLAWALNKDTDNLVHLFATFTNFMSNTREFSRTHGIKTK